MAANLQDLWDLQCIDKEIDQVSLRLRLLKERDDDPEQIGIYQKKLDKLEKKRAKQADKLDESTLETFDKLSETYNAEVMAPIRQSGHRKPYKYHCGGCFMSIPAEDANVLRQRWSMRTCDTCGRFLYFPDEESDDKEPMQLSADD
ncbi:MAG: C4-type zinc ribbon domain-containing protein [Phycisphaerae bacterium]